MKEERRILLVDDEPMVLKSVSRYLQTMGCAVTACADGYDALREASGGFFDMAVVDFDLPGLSGSALIEQLASVEYTLPIVVVSGATDLTVGRYMVNGEHIRFLAKPFDLDALLELMKELESRLSPVADQR